MPLIKLNRINKGGELILNSDQIMYLEIESRTTTIHLAGGELFSVEEPPATVVERVESLHVERYKKALIEAGLAKL